MMMSGKNYKFPFTAAQWQELEHQALIFKYIVSGIPLPPDLLFTIRRSRSYLDPALAPQQLFSSNGGWSCFKMGLGKKIDPEPGRCRRTDGKKWRCSKEAYADSKYCERHMHRGKNRSRKPVEVLKTTSITNKNFYSSQASSTTQSLSSPSIDDRPFLNYHHSSSSSRPTTGLGLSNQDSNTTLLLDSGFYSHSTDTDYNRGSSVYGVKAEEVENEHGFYSEQPSGTTLRDFSVSSSMDETWQLKPLNMSCHSPSKSQRSKECSYLQLQSFNDTPKEQSQDHHQQYFDVLMNNDIIKDERKEKNQKTIHRFFDEWPIRKGKDSWLDLDDNKSSNNGSVSTTQLSISIPSYDHFA